MAKTVFLHIGLPKTATTYLQTILWASRPQLRKAGVLLPGNERRDHLWATRVVRELDSAKPGHKPGASAEHEKAISTSWDRLCAEIAAWDGTAVISHEFFAAASTEQAERIIADLAPARVELVVTAREPLGLFAASWQESLKNRGVAPMAEYAREVSEDSSAIWNWRTLDVGLVLERWTTSLPAAQVHVLPLPDKSAPKNEIWRRFAGLIGIDPEAYDTSQSFPNESMGIVEAETMRRINQQLEGFNRSWERGRWLRTYLADERLVPRKGARFWPEDDRIEDCRRRGEAAVALIRKRGFDVIGDLDALLVPTDLADRPRTGSVSDAQVAEVAVALAAQMLADVRDLDREKRGLRRQRDRAQGETEAARATNPVRHAARWARDRIRPRT